MLAKPARHTALANAVLVATLTVTTAATKGKSNFIFVLTDDHGWSQPSFATDPTVPAAASSVSRNPNMARLARRGMRFTSGCSPAPVCTPTRSSIFCGMTPARQRGTEFKSEFDWQRRWTLPKALKQCDPNYRTAYFGKFGSDMGTSPDNIEFGEGDGWTTNRTAGRPTPMQERGRSVVKQDPKLAFAVTNRAIDFLERQARSHAVWL